MNRRVKEVESDSVENKEWVVLYIHRSKVNNIYMNSYGLALGSLHREMWLATSSWRVRSKWAPYFILLV